MEPGHLRIRGTDVRRQIVRQGLKQWWVAEATGVNRTTLQRWISGRISKVRRVHAERLAAVLDSPRSEFATER